MRTAHHAEWIWIPPLVALLLFGAISVSGTNQAVFLVLNHAGHFLGDIWWDNLTILGDAAIALALVLPIIRRAPTCFWAALVAGVIATLWVHLFKHLLPLPRPLAVLAPEVFFHSGPQLHAGSFPSGHSATIFILAGIGIMSRTLTAWLRWILLALAVLVSLSRIMVGVHWPLDVLAGMLIGWGAAYAGLRLVGKRGWKTHGAGGILACILLIGVAASLLVSTHTKFPAALTFQHLIGSVCLALGAVEFLRMLRCQRASWRARKRSLSPSFTAPAAAAAADKGRNSPEA